MQLHHKHPWDVTPREAIAIQQELAHLVQETPLSTGLQTVAGADASVRQGYNYGAIAILSFPELKTLHTSTSKVPVTFPYIPGLLAFRELPALLQALTQLPALPDVILCDGHGKAHPRRFGLASHLGVLLERPTVGCAKSRLVGNHGPLPDEKGAWVPLTDGDEIIGAVVRTRAHVRPVYVSVGHRITLKEAVELVLSTTTRYRIPEPLRHAHHLSRQLR